MNDQARVVKVIFSLMLAMTAGALILLKLEGKPIKPGGASLYSLTKLSSVYTALGTDARIEPGRWQRLEIAYTMIRESNLSSKGQLTGPLTLNYHFVIGDGTTIADGQIIPTDRWIRQLAALNRDSQSDPRQTIQISLMGDPLTQKSTAKQTRQLDALILSLARNCGSDLKITWR